MKEWLLLYGILIGSDEVPVDQCHQLSSLILPHRAYSSLAGTDAAVLVAEAALHIL
jgi:hypothetical protein